MTVYLSYAATGLLIGSFLNVLIQRLPKMLLDEFSFECQETFLSNTKRNRAKSRNNLRFSKRQNLARLNLNYKKNRENLWHPSSKCNNCKMPLKAIDNIPLLSYIMLRGKCRSCKKPIGFRYPLVEIMSSVAPVLIYFLFSKSNQSALEVDHITVAIYCVFMWITIALAFIDFETQLLPDNLTYILLWMGMLGSILNLTFLDPFESILGATLGYSTLWSIQKLFYLFTGKVGMGNGDFKLLAALLAWSGINSCFEILMIAACLGSLMGIILIFLKKVEKGTPIPFGPFLIVACYISLFLQIIDK